MTDIDRLVAENREQIRQVGGRFVEVDSNRDRDLKFGPNLFTVDVDATVYKRSTGSQVIFGHHDDEHGFGRGTFGDEKGEWVEAGTDVTVDAVFTKQGRRAVIQSLDGKEGAVFESKAGTDKTPAETGDESLTNVYAITRVLNGEPATNEVRSEGRHDAASWVGDPTEFGIVDRSDRLLARVVVEGTWDIADDDEVRLDVTLTFEGGGVGNSAVTNDGEDAVADAMADVYEVTGPVEFAFGSGSTEFDKTSSSLTDEQFRKGNERQTERDRIVAKTHVFEDEPGGVAMPVDISEMAVFDENNRMIWATTFRSFTKRDDAGFNAESEFRVS